MGFLSKASNFMFGNSGQKYDVNAALNQRQNTKSDLGNIKWKGNTRVFESSDNDKYRNNLIGQGLGNVQQGINSYSLDPTEASQAYYDQATRLLNDQFARERQSADTALINRGIQTGTDQYNKAMGDLVNNQNGTLQDIANQSVYLGQSNLGQQISNLGGQISNVNSLGSGRDINTLINMDSGSNSAYDDKYKSDIYRDLLRRQRNSNAVQFLYETPATGFASFTNSFMSDKRLKENLKPVGKLNNGLKVYVGNYKKETGLDTRPQLFLLAQEVKKKHPEAVVKKFGALAVDYKQATKKGE